MQIDHYLRSLVEKDASDLHFIAGQPPRMRVYGELAAFEEDILTADRTEDILREIMPESAEASAQVLEEDSTSKRFTACFPESSSRDSEEIEG